MKPLLVQWVCEWANCFSLTTWVRASWLVVTRQLPSALRPSMGEFFDITHFQEPQDDQDNLEESEIALGEVIESEV